MKKIQKKYRELSAEEQVRVIARVATDQKALDVVALDVQGLASFADYFVIMGGTSTRHVQGLADIIDREISSKRAKATETEGLSEGQWILLDYGDVIVHIFYHETRPDFDLEGLWHDAPRLDLTKPAPVVKEPATKKAARKVAPRVSVLGDEKSAGDIPPKTVKKTAAAKTAAKAARRSAAKPASNSAAKPARKTVAKPARKTVDKSASWTAEKPARKTAERSARWTKEKPAGKTAAGSARKTTGKSTPKPASRPVREVAAKQRPKTSGKPGRPAPTAKPKAKPTGRVKK